MDSHDDAVAVAKAYLSLQGEVDAEFRDSQTAVRAWAICVGSGRPTQAEIRGVIKALSKSRSPIDDKAILEIASGQQRRGAPTDQATLLLVANAASRLGRELDCLNALGQWYLLQISSDEAHREDIWNKPSWAQSNLIRSAATTEDLLAQIERICAVAPLAPDAIREAARSPYCDDEVRERLDRCWALLREFHLSADSDGDAVLEPEDVDTQDLPQVQSALNAYLAQRDFDRVERLLTQVPVERRASVPGPMLISTCLRLMRDTEGNDGVLNRILREPWFGFLTDVHAGTWANDRHWQSGLKNLGKFLLDEPLADGQLERLGEVLGLRMLANGSRVRDILESHRGTPRTQSMLVTGLLRKVPWYQPAEDSYLLQIRELARAEDGRDIKVLFSATRSLAQDRLHALGSEQDTVPIPPLADQGALVGIDLVVTLSEAMALHALVQSGEWGRIPSKRMIRLLAARPAVAATPALSLTEFDRWIGSAFIRLNEWDGRPFRDELFRESIDAQNDSLEPTSADVDVAKGLPAPLLTHWMYLIMDAVAADGSARVRRNARSTFLWQRVSRLLVRSDIDSARKLAIAEAFADAGKSHGMFTAIGQAIALLEDREQIAPSPALLEGWIASLPKDRARLKHYEKVRKHLLRGGSSRLSAGLWTPFIIGAFSTDKSKLTQTPEERALEAIQSGQAWWRNAVTELVDSEATGTLPEVDVWFSAGELTEILESYPSGLAEYRNLGRKFAQLLTDDPGLHDVNSGRARFKDALELVAESHHRRDNGAGADSLRQLWRAAFGDGDPYPRFDKATTLKPLTVGFWDEAERAINRAVVTLTSDSPVEAGDDLVSDLRRVSDVLATSPRFLTQTEVGRMQAAWANQIAHELGNAIPMAVSATFSERLPKAAQDLREIASRCDAGTRPGLMDVAAKLEQFADWGRPSMEYLRGLHDLFDATAKAGASPRRFSSLLLENPGGGDLRISRAIAGAVEGAADRISVAPLERSIGASFINAPATVLLWSLQSLVSNSMKHGRGTITIKASFEDDITVGAHGAVRILVVDEGDGLPEDPTYSSSPHRKTGGYKEGVQSTAMFLAAVGGRLDRVLVGSRWFHAIVLPLARSGWIAAEEHEASH